MVWVSPNPKTYLHTHIHHLLAVVTPREVEGATTVAPRQGYKVGISSA